ncbi:hypothetical protein N7517_002298 [Penicillium concentricum]|uniref:Uncharacterized protein n=1 Tax=Penicillium concentricum TaxID=293559 RepID=A0A9W9VJN3_9EURO|nr:uncharacterized protein N7517_002298 [Penicillium concentricum]KAJ5384387.1 hypothetical protein N7517_002298 [Penicillium concentricum]
MRSIGLLGDVPTTSVFSMMPMSLPSSFSPKRKREPSESDFYSPSASPISIASIDSFQEVPFRDEDELESYSPRAAVAGRFGELAICGDLFSDPGDLTGNSQRGSLVLPAQKACEPESHELKNMPEALPATSSEPGDRPALRFEPPASQDPTSLPTSLPISPSKKKSATFCRKQLNPSSPSKRKQRLSPLLRTLRHDPSDPTDDGYGINGIGFKPTASIAWERSQKRQKQVAEWKNREAREAREKRRERRRDGVELDKLHGINKGAVHKRVKFNL